MKKLCGVCLPLLCLCVFLLSGCHTIGEKSASILMVYLVTAVLAVFLLLGYAMLIKNKTSWFWVLFSAVAIVDIGYFWLASAETLSSALNANRLSYLGSVFLPLSMLMILLNITKLQYKRWLPTALLAIAAAVFLITATPGILPIYYKDVSLITVHGISALEKTYGPLHVLYLIYLVAYFIAMITVTVHAVAKKKMPSVAHAVILITATLVNLGVWLCEQLVSFEFEFLSVSYIITELFLLTLYWMIGENEKSLAAAVAAATVAPAAPAIAVDSDTLARFEAGLETLTPTERKVFDLYAAGSTTKDVLAALSITENTLKYHNKNLYSKLGVTSRKELIAIAKHRQTP